MNSNLLSLLQLSDPALPIGSFAHSAGLETYVQKKIVIDLESARAHLTAMLTLSIKYNDAAIMSLAFDATKSKDLQRLLALDWECAAVKIPSETRLASQKLGNRLQKLFLGLTKAPFLGAFAGELTAGNAIGNYCVVFGMVASLLDIDKADAVTGFYYNTTASFVTNAVKLIPLGQQEGQELLFSLQPLIALLANESLHPEESMIGYSCSGFDIRSMQHETLYSRLYMS